MLFAERVNIQYLDYESSLSNISSRRNNNTNNSFNDKIESLIPIANKTQFTKGDLLAITKTGKKYVIYDNYLIDVESFMDFHPGGFLHIEENLYNDISRFVTGTTATNGKFKPHSHSFAAINYIHTKIFGILNENHQIIIDSTLGNRYNYY